jgi:isopropylmalate/homocitrate/citramalate synthase
VGSVSSLAERHADIFSAFIKEAGLEVRFSTEDSFRSNLVDVLSVYSAVDKIGVNRVGIAGESYWYGPDF